MAGRSDADALVVVGIAKTDSYKVINEDIKSLQNYIEKKKLGIKVKINTGSKSVIKKDLQTALNGIEGLKVVVPKVTLGKGAIASLKKEISHLIKEVSGGTESVVFNSSKTKSSGANKSSSGVDAQTKEVEALINTYKKLKTTMNAVSVGSLSGKYVAGQEEQIENLSKRWDKLRAKINDARTAGVYKPSDTTAWTKEAGDILKAANSLETAAANARKYNKEIERINNALKKYENDDGDTNGSDKDGYKRQKEISALIDYREKLEKLRDAGTKFDGGITSTVTGLITALDGGKVFVKIGDGFSGLIKKFVGGTIAITMIKRAFSEMVKQTIALDDAFTQLRIVTGSTESEMRRFEASTINMAKRLGQSVTSVASSVETFSRLGYNLADASTLAEYAGILSNVASVTQNEATTGLTSIIKGYGMSVSNTEHVADVLTEVGQKYAISAGELMTAFERSGAALNATNTSFEKSAGLLAAANASIQNAEMVGTALKTVSARIRGSKAELTELGEDTEDLADGFSKYAAEIKALTGFNIMVEGSTNTFKDLYDIMDGIAAQWDKLSDTQRARVSEILGGVRQLQVISSIIGNWGDATNAYASAMNSAGAASKANDIYMESITAHINQFKATTQELANVLIEKGLINELVDLGTILLNILKTIGTGINYIGGLKTLLAGLGSLALNAKLYALATSGKEAASMIGKLVQSVITGKAAAVASQAGFVGLGRALKSASTGAITLQASLGAIGIALGAVVVISNVLKNAHEERIRRMDETAAAAREERDALANLIQSYKELSAGGDIESGSLEEARQIQEQITNLVGLQAGNLDLVNGKIDEETKKLDELAYKRAKNGIGGLTEARDEALKQYNLGADADGATNVYSAHITDAIFHYLHGNYSDNELELAGIMQGGHIFDPADLGRMNAKEIHDFYESMHDMLVKVAPNYDEGSSEYKRLVSYVRGAEDAMASYEDIIEKVDETQHNLDLSSAIIDVYEAQIKTKKGFDEYISSVKNSAEYTNDYKTILIDTANNAFPQFVNAAEVVSQTPLLDDAYANVKKEFEGIAETIDSISTSMGTLASIQETVANGFEMPIEKAMEFAKVYPQILEKAEVSANGQIKLNEDVVNALISGKQEELEATANGKISELEIERDVAIAKMEFAREQLKIAEEATRENAELTKEEAQYRINVGNAVRDALIASNISEADANKVATAAMSKNEQEFAKVVAAVCYNMDNNFSEAAYNTAVALYKNMLAGQHSVADLANIARKAARAVAGIPEGIEAEEVSVNSDFGGTRTRTAEYYDPRLQRAASSKTENTAGLRKPSNGYFSLVYGGDFSGADFSLSEYVTSIDDFVAGLHTEIAGYEKAIALLDGQIAALRASTNLSTYSSGATSGSGGGSGTSSDPVLDNFKSIVSLLETQLKLMEAQGAPAQDRINKMREIQDALRDEIMYLQQIGGDEETINNLSIQWLNYQKDIEKVYEDTQASAKGAIDDLVKYRIKMLEDELKKEKQALDDRLDALKKFYDKQKEMLRDQYDEEKYLEEQAEKRKAVSDLEAQLEQLRYDDSAWAQKRRLELEEQLAKARKELEDFERDHALEVTEDELDRMYELQAAEMERERDALEDKLDDDVGLYQQALEDIKNGGIDMYNALIAWNDLYGDHIASTITDAWEAAYKALQDYKDLYGEDYDGVSLANATGYTPPQTPTPQPNPGSSGGAGGSGSSGGGSPGSGGGGSGRSFPYGKASDTTGIIDVGSTGNQVKAIQYALNQLGFGNEGTKDLDGGYGSGTQAAVMAFQRATGAVVDGGVGDETRGKFRSMGYYTGTSNATPGMHRINENGAEYVLGKNGARYRLFTGGEKVLDANATDFLYRFANFGKRIWRGIITPVMPKYDIMKAGGAAEVHMGDIIIQGNADEHTVSEIRRAQRDGLSYVLREFNKMKNW